MVRRWVHQWRMWGGGGGIGEGRGSGWEMGLFVFCLKLRTMSYIDGLIFFVGVLVTSFLFCFPRTRTYSLLFWFPRIELCLLRNILESVHVRMVFTGNGHIIIGEVRRNGVTLVGVKLRLVVSHLVGLQSHQDFIP